jgi:MFS family permease
VKDIVGTEKKEYYLSFVGIFGTFGHMIATPIFGFLSDQIHTSFGKRRIWIAIFVPISCIGLLSLSMFTSNEISNISFVILLLVFFQIILSGAIGPYSGLLPDLIKKENHGIASGFQSLALTLGTFGGIVGSSEIFRSLTSKGFILELVPSKWKYFASYLYLSLGLLISSYITVFIVSEKSHEVTERKFNFWNSVKLFYFSCKVYYNLYIIIIYLFFFYMGINMILPFIQYFLKDVLGFEKVVLVSSIVLTLKIIFSAVGSILSGYLSDKIGPKPVLIVGLWLMIAPLGLAIPVLLIFKDWTCSVLLAVLFSLFGFGYGVTISPVTVILLQSLPKETMARDFGIANQFVSVGLIFGSLVGGQIINLIKQYSVKWAYIGIFTSSCVCYLLTFVLTLLLKVTSIGVWREKWKIKNDLQDEIP